MFKKFLLAALVIPLASFTTRHQGPPAGPDGTSLRTIKNEAFARGERIKYRVHYGFVDAGEAVIEITQDNKQIAGRNTMHVVGKGYSKGAFDWFFKVRDQYESYIDEDAVVPWVFIRRVNEGGYKITQNQVYNQYKGIVDSDGKSFTVPDGIQDMISAFYYARTLDFSNAKEGDMFNLTCFMDNEIFPLKIKYVGRENVELGIGTFKCLKFRPVVQKGRIFKHEEDLNVWITDDKNKIPVRAQASILVGSIKMDLKEYSGLANPISKVND